MLQSGIILILYLFIYFYKKWVETRLINLKIKYCIYNIMKFEEKKAWKCSWLKNSSKDGGAQSAVLDKLEPDEIPICSITKKYGRMWSRINKEDYILLVSKNRGIYEIIQADVPRKVYFDLDVYDVDNFDINIVKEKIIEKFPNAIMAISGYDTPNKISRHIILMNYHFKNLEEQKKMLPWLSVLVYLGVDSLVYTRNRLMKCVNQSKPEANIQEDLSGNTIEEHSILFVSSTSMDAGELDWEEFETTKKDLKVDILKIPQFQLPNPKAFDLLEANSLEILNIIPNHKKTEVSALGHIATWKIMLWAKENNISFESFWSWASQADNDFNRMERYNGYWNSTYGFSCGIKFILTVLKRFYPNITKPHDVEKFISGFNIPDTHTTDDRFLSKDDLVSDAKYILLGGDMGTNKTGSVIANLDPKDRILWLSPRKSLTNNVLERIITVGGFRFQNYLNYTGKKSKELPSFKHLICCFPSIKNTRDAVYDTVVIDEIETLIMMARGGEGCPGAQVINLNWIRFKDIIKNAKKVYVMDAFLNIRTQNLLQAIDPQPSKSIITPGVPIKRTFVKYKGNSTWLYNLGEKLKAGENIFVFYPYKNANRTYPSMFQVVNILMKLANLPMEDFICYHADQPDSIKETTGDVHNTWKNKRCVICNTSISVGVNFDLKYFDCIFAHWARWVSHRDFFQNLYRCRYLKSNEIHLVITGNAFNSPFMHADLECPIYKQLLKEIKREENTKGSLDVFKYYATRCNIQTQVGVKQVDKTVRKLISNLINESECVFRWNRIKDISYQRMENNMEKIINNWTDSIDNVLEVRKYRFREHFHEETPDEVLESLWNSNKFSLIDGLFNVFSKNIQIPETKIVYSIFEQNNAEDTLELPKHPIWDYNLKEIKRNFETRVINEESCYNSVLISNILSAYFKTPVFESTKERSHVENDHARKLTDFKMNDTFLTIKDQVKKYGLVERFTEYYNSDPEEVHDCVYDLD